MKKLFIHAGLHKTGTTAIQKFLYQNRHSLFKDFELANRYEEDFLKVPDTLAIRMAIDEISAIGQASAVTQSRSNAVLQRLLESSKPKALLSDETLLGVHVGRDASRGFYPNLCERAEVLAQLFRDFEMHLIVYVRASSAWKKSVYNQLLKTLATEMTFEEFEAFYDIPVDFEESIASRLPQGVFGSVSILHYENEFTENAQYPMEFLKKLGISSTLGATPLSRENSSPQKGNLLLIQHHLLTCRIAKALIEADCKKEAGALLQANSKICSSPKSAELMKKILDQPHSS